MRYFVDAAAMFGGVALIYLAFKVVKRFVEGPEWLIDLAYGLDDFLFQWARNLIKDPEPDLVPDLRRWNDDLPQDQQQWFRITQIEVPSEDDKQQLLLACDYIHDLFVLDTSYMAVNYLAHLSEMPHRIVVRPTPTTLI